MTTVVCRTHGSSYICKVKFEKHVINSTLSPVYVLENKDWLEKYCNWGKNSICNAGKGDFSYM